MEVQLLDKGLLEGLHEKAATSERLRQNFDLRTTPEDGSQRMLNVLEVGTKVPIHRHLKTSETVVCLEDVWTGCSMRSRQVWIPVVLCMMARWLHTRHNLLRLLGLGCAPVRRCMGYRCLRVLGTQLRCMNRAPYLKRRMGRTGSDS